MAKKKSLFDKIVKGTSKAAKTASRGSGGGGGTVAQVVTGSRGGGGGGRSRSSGLYNAVVSGTSSAASSAAPARSRRSPARRTTVAQAVTRRTSTTPLRPRVLENYIKDPPSGSPLSRVLRNIERTSGERPRLRLDRRVDFVGSKRDGSVRVSPKTAQQIQTHRDPATALKGIATVYAAARVPKKKKPSETTRIATRYAHSVVDPALKPPKPRNTENDRRRRFALPERPRNREVQIPHRRAERKRGQTKKRLPTDLRQAGRIARRQLGDEIQLGRAGKGSSRRRGGKVKVGVPEVVPEKWRDEVAKFGLRFMDEATKGTGMTGPEYLAKLIEFESSWDPSARNPSGATGLGQFMPGTRASFVQQYGVDPYKNPRQAIKGAAMHASGDFGHAPLYAGYNPGYSSQDPILGVEGGRNVNVKVPRKATKGARIAPGQGSVKQKKGEWAGSERAIGKVLRGLVDPAEWKGDKRTPSENAAVGGATASDHLTTSETSFAGDLPPDDRLAQKIAKKLGLPSHTGTNEVVKDGYRYQLIWQDSGHYDHIHLGAEWVGDGVPAGTVLGGSAGGGGAPMSPGVSVPGAPAPVDPANVGALSQQAASGEKGSRAASRDLYLMLSGGRSYGGGSGFTRSPIAARAPLPAQYRNVGGEDEDEEERLYRLLDR